MLGNLKKIVLLGLSFILLSSCSYYRVRKAVRNDGYMEANRVFVDTVDEENLAQYFMNSTQKMNCRKLVGVEKDKYLSLYWESFDPNPQTSDNEFLIEINERIDYANMKIRGSREGWRSDQGRIFIKYGEPSDIEKGFVLGGLHAGTRYEVWKYRADTKYNDNFIFIEVQTFGEMRLVYNEDNDEEGFANWQELLGESSLDDIIYRYYN